MSPAALRSVLLAAIVSTLGCDDRTPVAPSPSSRIGLERYMRSTDPDFETKAAAVIGLYLAPPQHAAVFCLDEKTAIQALDRVDPVSARCRRAGPSVMDFEYKRHGTLSLYAALNTRTGEDHRPDGRTTHQCGLPRVPGRGHRVRNRRHARFTSFSTILRRTKRRRSGRSWLAHPPRAAALHADLLLVAESSRTLVRQDRA